jgi:hypothetical protein
VNAARAFDEDYVAWTQILLEPPACGFGVGKKDRCNSASAGRSGKVFGVTTNANDHVDASFRGSFAGCGVERGTVLAKLKHFSGDKDATATGA